MSHMSTAALRCEIEQMQHQIYELQLRVQRAAGFGLEALPAGELLLLECRAEEQRIALLLDRVEEAVPAAALAPLPESPPWVLGMLNLRGATIPVLDVAARLLRRGRRLELSDLIVVCTLHERRIGLAVQEIHHVLRVLAGSISEPAPDLPHAPYLLGVCSTGTALLTLISIERLVALSDIPELAA